MKKTTLTLALFSALFLFGCETDEDYSMMEGNDMMEENDMMNDHMMVLASDEDFLAMMIPHHQEAIDTSKIILEKSENVELKAMAQDIIEAQTAEIEQMEAWGKEWFGTSFEPSEDYEKMMPNLTRLEGEDLDQAYIEGMIEHHKGAIDMAEQIKVFTERPELLEMAEDIIKAQTEEIEVLKTWLK